MAVRLLDAHTLTVSIGVQPIAWSMRHRIASNNWQLTAKRPKWRGICRTLIWFAARVPICCTSWWPNMLIGWKIRRSVPHWKRYFADCFASICITISLRIVANIWRWVCRNLSYDSCTMPCSICSVNCALMPSHWWMDSISMIWSSCPPLGRGMAPFMNACSKWPSAPRSTRLILIQHTSNTFSILTINSNPPHPTNHHQHPPPPCHHHHLIRDNSNRHR